MQKHIQKAVESTRAAVKRTGEMVGGAQAIAKQTRDAVGRPGAWPGYFMLLLGALMLFGIVRTAFFGSTDASTHLWVELTLLLLIAVVAERLVQQWKQPFVMVLLLLGVLISPHTLAAVWPPAAGALAPLLAPYGFHPDPARLPNLVTDSELVKTFASFGAIILLFRIGLHSKLEAVFNLKNMLVALGGVLLPFIAGFLYAFYFGGGDFAYSIFVGAALTATSVGITAAVLEEMGLLHKPFAQTILGAAVIDDILALMVLGMIRNIPSAAGPEAFGPLLSTLAIAALFVVCGLFLGRLFIRSFFGHDEAELSKRSLCGLLAILFFYAFSAESLGLSAIVGAFLAGLVISGSPLAPLLNRALFPLDALLVPIFFIWLGLLVDAWAIPAVLGPLLILSAIAVLTKMAGCGLVARFFGMNAKDSLLVGFGMVPRGEIALIIASLGLTTISSSGAPILSAAQYTLIASMAFLTTIIVPAGLRILLAASAEKSIG